MLALTSRLQFTPGCCHRLVKEIPVTNLPAAGQLSILLACVEACKAPRGLDEPLDVAGQCT